jgi:hypothetical protein
MLIEDDINDCRKIGFTKTVFPLPVMNQQLRLSPGELARDTVIAVRPDKVVTFPDFKVMPDRLLKAEVFRLASTTHRVTIWTDRGPSFSSVPLTETELMSTPVQVTLATIFSFERSKSAWRVCVTVLL